MHAHYLSPDSMGVHLAPDSTDQHSAKVVFTHSLTQFSLAELVVEKGYPLETYEVVTEDGYILTVYRIPHGKQRHTQKGNKPVVYLQHGITLASNSFAILNANESMAFILADAGEEGGGWQLGGWGPGGGLHPS